MIDDATNTQLRPVRSNVELSDPHQVGPYLEAAYQARMRLHRSTDHAGESPLLRHGRTDAGAFVIDEMRMPGTVDAKPDALNRVMAVWVNAGRVSGHCDGVDSAAGAGDIALMSQPDLPYEVLSEDLTATVLLLDPALVVGAAHGKLEAVKARSLRFEQFTPVNAAAARMWRDTVTYVRDCVLADDTKATPLVLGHAGRLLGAVTMSAFPGVVPTAQAAQYRTDASPLLLRRAIAYIEENAGNDIALSDIALAVHISPRAVQYMFRRHLETTPLQYLRRIRLDRAHRELIVADRKRDTVTAIAAKWGFAHTGRFAVMYREAYGRSPHATLRD
ncbi:helix-turn-helix transcriptional regulator [Mycolicibacterium arseniciresistens]|uniref:Helix-turn-helix transcriptional regulator n=1 Tax=Mycolicibacterium arseniciresistens TaxID=3062257 RepID=A0ABT8UQM3_9MYCO|nr:helix-turn-helix transcriptional regulator [Mycolicibacterium arseniciresistens]MDO3638698.1 helix-turn-helix transcriptional regulator [Mycolicibacterium arseniciresistens]